MTALIQLRRDDAAVWTAVNPVLSEGEVGLELDTGRLKYGNGASTWNALDYFPPSGVGDVEWARKTADETVNNSNTVQDDNHLTAPVGANQTWQVELGLILAPANITPDYRFAMHGPAGSTGWFALMGLAAATTGIEDNFRSHYVPWTQATQANPATDMLAVGAPATAATFVLLKFQLVTVATAGNLKLQWAQSIANASNSVIKAGSYMRAERIA